MIPPLQLRLISAPGPRAVEAGFVPGSDTAAWLAEMARNPHGRFFAVPASAGDMEPGGLLILPGSAGAAVSWGPRVVPCALEHGRVVVPASTRLDPQLTAEEARHLFPHPVYFFHPGLGLVGFDAADAITPAMLVVPPLVREVSWMEATTGRARLPKLTRVVLALPDGLEGLFGAATQDIGSASPKDLGAKAPLGQRLKDGLKKGLGGAAAALLGGLAGLFGGGKPRATPPPLPGAGANAGTGSGAGAPGVSRWLAGGGFKLVNSVLNWTASQMERLERQRSTEINRLMKMLETNPDEGLKYALPMGGESGRGVAPPGGSLGPRNPVYGGGFGARGPGDVWNLPANTQWQLQQRYRQLANRELAEKRYDRAAYILAHLLGDWHGAAGALVQGKRFQEAAQIYQDRLNNRAMAAKCLEDGGLLHEAVLIYAAMGHHETCGDILRRMGREAEAVQAYQKALQGGTDRLHDARVLFEKLNQPALAIAVLATGHPGGHDARACLERHFSYLARLGAQEESLALAASLARPECQIQPPAVMVETLAALHRDQADAAVRTRLAAAGVALIGRCLTGSQGRDKALLETLPKFAPDDLILRRDARRFLTAREVATRARNRRPATGPRGQPVRSGTFQLPADGTRWSRLVSHQAYWLACGHHPKTRQDVWTLGHKNEVIGKLTSAHGWGSDLHLLPLLMSSRSDFLGAWLPMARHEQPARYARARRQDFSHPVSSREPMLDALAWLPGGLLAAQADDTGFWVLHSGATGTINLSYYGLDGRLVRTHAMGWEPPELALPLHLAVHQEQIYIASGSVLLSAQHGRVTGEMAMDAPVHHLAASPVTHPCAALVVAGPEAVLVKIETGGGTHRLHSSASGEPPVACFLGDGRVLTADSSDGCLHSGFSRTELTTFNLPQNRPCSLVAAAAWEKSSFALLWQDGWMEFYD